MRPDAKRLFARGLGIVERSRNNASLAEKVTKMRAAQ